jgi:hypothetical protein
VVLWDGVLALLVAGFVLLVMVRWVLGWEETGGCVPICGRRVGMGLCGREMHPGGRGSRGSLMPWWMKGLCWMFWVWCCSDELFVDVCLVNCELEYWIIGQLISGTYIELVVVMRPS